MASRRRRRRRREESGCGRGRARAFSRLNSAFSKKCVCCPPVRPESEREGEGGRRTERERESRGRVHPSVVKHKTKKKVPRRRARRRALDSCRSHPNISSVQTVEHSVESVT